MKNSTLEFDAIPRLQDSIEVFLFSTKSIVYQINYVWGEILCHIAHKNLPQTLQNQFQDLREDIKIAVKKYDGLERIHPNSARTFKRKIWKFYLDCDKSLKDG